MTEGIALLLGCIQGLTEFLPISSSGHLVVVQHLLGMEEPQLLFDVCVHTGTLVAVILFYRRELCGILREVPTGLTRVITEGSFMIPWREQRYFRLAVLLLLATIPAACVGYFLNDLLERAFSSLSLVGGALLVTGSVLALTRRTPAVGRGIEDMGIRDALLIGCAQAFAILPGISRSGMTISAGLFCGLERGLSARFSFLLSIPIILGANLLEISRDWQGFTANSAFPITLGLLSAMASGYVALKLLVRIVQAGRLSLFSYYCWGVGLLILLFSVRGAFW